jgi:hypothetical protein
MPPQLTDANPPSHLRQRRRRMGRDEGPLGSTEETGGPRLTTVPAPGAALCMTPSRTHGVINPETDRSRDLHHGRHLSAGSNQASPMAARLEPPTLPRTSSSGHLEDDGDTYGFEEDVGHDRHSRC